MAFLLVQDLKGDRLASFRKEDVQGATIAQLRRKLVLATGIPAHQQQLVFGTTVLTDNLLVCEAIHGDMPVITMVCQDVTACFLRHVGLDTAGIEQGTSLRIGEKAALHRLQWMSAKLLEEIQPWIFEVVSLGPCAWEWGDCVPAPNNWNPCPTAPEDEAIHQGARVIFQLDGEAGAAAVPRSIVASAPVTLVDLREVRNRWWTVARHSYPEAAWPILRVENYSVDEVTLKLFENHPNNADDY